MSMTSFSLILTIWSFDRSSSASGIVGRSRFEAAGQRDDVAELEAVVEDVDVDPADGIDRRSSGRPSDAM